MLVENIICATCFGNQKLCSWSLKLMVTLIMHWSFKWRWNIVYFLSLNRSKNPSSVSTAKDSDISLGSATKYSRCEGDYSNNDHVRQVDIKCKNCGKTHRSNRVDLCRNEKLFFLSKPKKQCYSPRVLFKLQLYQNIDGAHEKLEITENLCNTSDIVFLRTF